MSTRKRKLVRVRTARAGQAKPRGLPQAYALIEDGRFGDAVELLDDLDLRSPGTFEVLEAQAALAYKMGAVPKYEALVEHMVAARPDDADTAAALTVAHSMNGHVGKATAACRRFVECWPAHEWSPDCGKLLQKLEGDLPRVYRVLGLTGEDALDLLLLHETALTRMAAGDYAGVQKAAEDLLARKPDFVPALNNLSQALWAQGRRNEAAATAGRVLVSDPDNVHALSNLARHLMLDGREDEALALAKRLQDSKAHSPDKATKTAEALSLLGDDDGVLRAFKSAGPEELAKPATGGLLHHLAAVAALRLGREGEARDLWARCLRLVPGFDPARRNVEDLDRAPGHQDGPWAFDFGVWRRGAVGRVVDAMSADLQSDDEKLAAGIAEAHRHPGILRVVRAMLDRGDPIGREFAVRLADALGTPEALAALREFGLGQRGTDAIRSTALRRLREHQALSTEPVRFWSRGEWRDVSFRKLRIHYDLVDPYAPEVNALLVEAYREVSKGPRGAAQAERLLKRAAVAVPDSPHIQYNLAKAYEMQGRRQEARDLIRQIHEQFPDYVFARSAMARLALMEGRLEEARALLAPLLVRESFHGSEFGAFAVSEIELLCRTGESEAAWDVFHMLESVDCEKPVLDAAADLLRQFGDA